MLRDGRICSIAYINSLLRHDLLLDMPSASNDDHDGRYPRRSEWLQNGFPNRTDSSIAWSDSDPDRTFTIDTTNGSFDYFMEGVKYTKTSAETIQITDTEGLWTFYYDGNTLTSQHNPTKAQLETIILSKAWIAFVYWDAVNNVGTFFEERHGIIISPHTHRELHFTVGTTFFDGLALGDFVISDGADNEDAQFSVATGQIFDEDIKYTTNTINKTTGVDVWYRSNGDWRKNTQTGFKVLTQDGTSSTRLSYDNAGTRTEVTDNKFVLYHVFAWNAVDLNPIMIMGQAEYATAKLARIGATTEINSLLLTTLPSKEMKAIATVIFQTKDTYANDVNAKVVQTDEGENYVDWRTAEISPSSVAGDHGLLAGLADDDHTQYFKDSDIGRTLAGLTLTADLDMTNDDIENCGTVYYDDTTGYLLRITSDGTDGGTLYNLGLYWDTATNYMRLRGFSGVALDVQLNNVLTATTTTMTIVPNLETTGSITVGDELMGARVLFDAASNSLNFTTAYLKFNNGATMTARRGYDLPRGGSIVGFTGSIDCIGFTPGPSVFAVFQFLINDVIIDSDTITISSIGRKNIQAEVGRGIYTFSQGDLLTMKVDKLGAGTATLATPCMVTEVQLDE